jgi:hypothetical protein
MILPADCRDDTKSPPIVPQDTPMDDRSDQSPTLLFVLNRGTLSERQLENLTCIVGSPHDGSLDEEAHLSQSQLDLESGFPERASSGGISREKPLRPFETPTLRVEAAFLMCDPKSSRSDMEAIGAPGGN